MSWVSIDLHCVIKNRIFCILQSETCVKYTFNLYLIHLFNKIHPYLELL